MDIVLCFILKLIYIRRAEVDQEACEASGIELFMAEVSGWKLLTIAVEGFPQDVTWSLDSTLNKYLRSWNLIN